MHTFSFGNKENLTKEQTLQVEFMTAMHRLRRDKMEYVFQDISQKEFFMLTKITDHGQVVEKGIYVSELAHLLKVSTPAVSRMLKGLEEKDLIRREIDQNDRRNTMVYLTENGITLLKQQSKILDELMERVIHRMGFEKMEQLIKLWNLLADSVEKEVEEREHV